MPEEIVEPGAQVIEDAHLRREVQVALDVIEPWIDAQVRQVNRSMRGNVVPRGTLAPEEAVQVCVKIGVLEELRAHLQALVKRPPN